MENILKAVSEYVSKLLSENLSEEFAYHNLLHTKEVTASAYDIGKNSGLSKRELELVQLATWFHDTGFVIKYKGHEDESIRIATEFLKDHNFSNEDLETVTNLIRVTELPAIPNSKLEEVIKDADILNIGLDAFFNNNERIRLEREQIENIVIDEKEWLSSSLSFIQNADFYTDYAKKKYGEKRKENIQDLSRRLKVNI